MQPGLNEEARWDATTRRDNWINKFNSSCLHCFDRTRPCVPPIAPLTLSLENDAATPSCPQYSHNAQKVQRRAVEPAMLINPEHGACTLIDDASALGKSAKRLTVFRGAKCTHWPKAARCLAVANGRFGEKLT
jgi:hypothetical protein